MCNKSTEKKYKNFHLDYGNEKHNKYTDQNIKDGIEGEKFVQYLEKNKMNIGLEYNLLNKNYYHQHGADLWNKDVCIEVKNLSDSYYLNLDWAIELDEKYRGYKIRALFVSIITSNKVKKYLKERGWFIVEWGKKLTGQPWDNAISNIMESKQYSSLMWAKKK